MKIQIDLRPFWDYVRDQGARSSCLACAASDAHMVFHELDHSLSAEYLFYKSAEYMPNGNVSNGITFESLGFALELHGQPRETEWPYQSTEPRPWTPPAITKVWMAKSKAKSGSCIKAVNQLIATGLPFVLVIRLTDGFINVGGPMYAIPSAGHGFGGHAVLAIGVGSDAVGDEHLLIRNSWGAGWGGEGHAWLPMKYLSDKLLGFCDLAAVT